MRYALFWSGGKDSLLALDRAQQNGLEVSHLVNIYEGSSSRVRFHGVRKDVIASQAKALGIDLPGGCFRSSHEISMGEGDEATVGRPGGAKVLAGVRGQPQRHSGPHELDIDVWFVVLLPIPRVRDRIPIG